MVKRMFAVATMLVLTTGALSACGDSGDEDSATAGSVSSTTPSSTTTPAATAPPTTPPVTAPPETAAPAPAPASATMPDVMCMNLQDAQDTIQANGVFFSGSFDATGQDRNQIVDSNWVVVSQEPPAGAPIGEGDARLGAVKYGEPSPC